MLSLTHQHSEATARRDGGGCPAPIATIVIATRNRKEELRRTLAACMTQDAGGNGNWIETLVVDDDSSDGTREMIAAEFPSVRVIHKTQNPGYMVSRNRGAKEALGPVIFSVDDDAVYTSPDTMLHTLKEFDHPRVGAVAIPHIHVTDGPREYDRSPDPDVLYIGATYVGTAYAVRRDVFLALGGYQEALVHQTEESEFCIRMLNAGYVVRLGTSATIHHFPSLIRNYKRQLHLGARNSVLFSWINVPVVFLPFRLAGNIINGCHNAMRLRHPWSFISGVARGLVSIPGWWSLRRPVAVAPYRLARRLLRRGPLPLADAENALPPPRDVSAFALAPTAPRS